MKVKASFERRLRLRPSPDSDEYQAVVDGLNCTEPVWSLLPRRRAASSPGGVQPTAACIRRGRRLHAAAGSLRHEWRGLNRKDRQTRVSAQPGDGGLRLQDVLNHMSEESAGWSTCWASLVPSTPRMRPTWMTDWNADHSFFSEDGNIHWDTPSIGRRSRQQSARGQGRTGRGLGWKTGWGGLGDAPLLCALTTAGHLDAPCWPAAAL